MGYSTGSAGELYLDRHGVLILVSGSHLHDVIHAEHAYGCLHEVKIPATPEHDDIYQWYAREWLVHGHDLVSNCSEQHDVIHLSVVGALLTAITNYIILSHNSQ